MTLSNSLTEIFPMLLKFLWSHFPRPSNSPKTSESDHTPAALKGLEELHVGIKEAGDKTTGSGWNGSQVESSGPDYDTQVPF